jgi:hypothetical protein
MHEGAYKPPQLALSPLYLALKVFKAFVSIPVSMGMHDMVICMRKPSTHTVLGAEPLHSASIAGLTSYLQARRHKMVSIVSRV